jgi:hypothetical protein
MKVFTDGAMRDSILTIAILGLALGAWSGAAQAEEFVSQYTAADVKKCRKFESIKIEGSEHAAAWVCKGLAGYVVVVSEDDLRTSVSVGRTIKAAGEEPAASEGFAAFNSTHGTIEWRSLKGAAKPFAIIQRWSISDYDERTEQRKSRQALIVTRLPPGPVCHVAHVDVPGNRDANAMARKAADELARKFKCGTDEVHVVRAAGPAAETAKQ